MQEDKFAAHANEYDAAVKKQRNVEAMAKSIHKAITLEKPMEIMDFGAGTGLLTAQLAPLVSKITAVDISPSMLEVLKQKNFACEVELWQKDLAQECIAKEFDAIVSSMTLHHIANIPKLLSNFYRMIKKGGSLALCDLYPEDGTFHSVNSGVEHLGIDPKMLAFWLEDAGFKSVDVTNCVTITKPHGTYETFTVSAKKH